MYPELFVLRHGQTSWNAEGRHQGQMDSALTELGRLQAMRQGRHLAALELSGRLVDCFVSPLGRARATAEIALAAIGRTATVDARLAEIDFGEWQGLTRAEIDLGWPDTRGAHPFDWHFTAPRGEEFDVMLARVSAFLDHLGGPAVIVTHGITSRLLRGLWLGLDRAGMAALDGGQGVVFHLCDGRQTRIGDG